MMTTKRSTLRYVQVRGVDGEGVCVCGGGLGSVLGEPCSRVYRRGAATCILLDLSMYNENLNLR